MLRKAVKLNHLLTANAETLMVWKKKQVNTMVADDLAPKVARSSAAMVLTM